MPESLKPADPVLVVDDDDRVRDAMSITLRCGGYNNVVLCGDSRLVDGLLREQPFSLMLLDLNMPYVTGNQVIRNTMSMADAPPIVVIAASTRVEDFADGVRGGIVDYLVKPVDRVLLLETVRRVLSQPPGESRQRLTRDYLLFDRIGAADATGMGDLLTRTRTEYRRLMETLPAPYVVLEPGTLRVRYGNRAFTRFLERPVSALASFTSILDPVSAEAFTAVLRDGMSAALELRGTKPTGEPFVIACSVHVSPADGYVETGFIDVTAATRLQEQLARSARLESIGAMAGGLAHDFNNLLMALGGYAELIGTTPGLPASVLDASAEMQAVVQRGNAMVRRLLSLGAPRGEERVLADVNAVLRGMEQELRLLLTAGQHLEVRPEARAPFVEMAASHVDQVVRNLVINARDAMPGGGVVTLSTRDLAAEGKQGARVALDVQDTGVGMDAATMARIFEPFFTTKAEGKGSGFGLPMVHSLLEAAGGILVVESAPDKGSLFSVQLPSAAAPRT